MKKLLLTGIITVVGAFAFAAIGLTEKKGANVSSEKPTQISEKAQAVADLAMAAQLAEYGRTNKNPMALLVAAQIMKHTPVQEKKRTKKVEGTGGAEKGDKKGTLDTPEKLLSEAKNMAEGNMDLVSLIEQQAKIAGHKGRIGGPIIHKDTVRGTRTDIYKVNFRGRELARVGLIGDGDCDLDLYVYDESGNLIASHTDRRDRCIVQWTPLWTGPFAVVVKNLSAVYARYILVTN